MSAGFMYFFPRGEEQLLERGVINPAILTECGLSSVFSETPVTDQGNTCLFHQCAGPFDVPGMVLYPMPAHGEKPPQTSYHPASQRWFDRGKFWIGLHKKNEPQPRDLARQDTHPGMRLTDRRKRVWTIPVIRMPDGSGSLPVEYGFSKDGELYTQICPEFNSVWELAGDALDYLQAAASPAKNSEKLTKNWPESRLLKMAVQFLSVNYRVSVHEITALMEAGEGVFDTDFVTAVLMAVVNWPLWVEYLDAKEKKNPATSATE